MKIEVSNGEILDKLSIIEIKLNEIQDLNKLKNVESEYRVLIKSYDSIIQTYGNDIEIWYNRLKYVNQLLWNIEDKIRKLEAMKCFSNEFIVLARMIYTVNDIRSKYKLKINLLTNSKLIEEKKY